MNWNARSSPSKLLIILSRCSVPTVAGRIGRLLVSGGFAFSIIKNGIVNENYEQIHKEKIDYEKASSAAAARLAGGLRADYGFVATIDREIRRDPEREIGYGITLQGAPISPDTELG
ncbi:hypothetical protein Tco_0491241 [Tanacetum coccineum]